MSEDLKLSLERNKPGKGGRRGWIVALLVVVIALSLANLYLQLTGAREDGGSSKGLSSGELEDLALKLEKQQLRAAATRAWIDYLESARPGKEERARIWYRIGKLYQGAAEYERALDAYYRSERLGEIKEIQTEISMRAAECLENLGKFAALQFELEERTSFAGADSAGGADVLAEIGSRRITRTDLDMMIEAEIDAQLSQLAAGLTPEERRMQKERLLESVLGEGERAKWLERFIAEELLYRRAREEKLHEKPELRDLSRYIERKILAQKYLELQYAAVVSVTPEEIRKYYDANRKEFEAEGELKPFEEVQNQIFAAIRSQKEMDVQQRVLEGLMDQYDVVIHRSKIGEKNK
jgi:hypothetical protein